MWENLPLTKIGLMVIGVSRVSSPGSWNVAVCIGHVLNIQTVGACLIVNMCPISVLANGLESLHINIVRSPQYEQAKSKCDKCTDNKMSF